MIQANMLVASAAVIALTLGVTSRAEPPKQIEAPLPLGTMIIAADDMQPSADPAENSQGSAKMGEEEGVHEGDVGATPESDTNEVDQPARHNPSTGAAAGDQTGAH